MRESTSTYLPPAASPHGRSYTVICPLGQQSGETLKKAATKVVAIKTDDMEITFGLYLGQTKGGYHKIAYCRTEDNPRISQWPSQRGKPKWEVIAVNPKRVVQFETLSADGFNVKA